MDTLWSAIWSFITLHWPDLLGGLTAIKLGADTYESVNKILPLRLETKEKTQTTLNDAVTLLNDQNIDIEAKQWELDTRRELAESMVRLSAIEATYNIARAGLIMAYFTVILHFLMRLILGTNAKMKRE